ncbi:MAG: hypothetical protein P1U89_16725 [Verrucomicrobiales bacterium]|nr:hypothetical protein [Verrucomicrobiales bacterium]
MSLKHFHLLFIVLSILITLGFGLWAVLLNGLPSGFKAMGGFSLFLSVILIVYGIRFLRKSKSIII